MESIKIIKRRRKSNWINSAPKRRQNNEEGEEEKGAEKSTKRSAQYYITFMCTWARFLSVVQFQPGHCARPLSRYIRYICNTTRVYQIHFAAFAVIYMMPGPMFSLVSGTGFHRSNTKTFGFGPANSILFCFLICALSTFFFYFFFFGVCVRSIHFIVFAKWRRKINNNKAIYGRFSPRRPLRYAFAITMHCIRRIRMGDSLSLSVCVGLCAYQSFQLEFPP